ncbi:hypothetical protein DEU56DRAFT_315523 [Suillus clintonianus]|uniref:uncharacterized protein n=1 Tax=Suillus clintonianus TaxID=1904413 RepID=UPI001B862EFC|nr:uncharacterized protein DEU56DRAFT_315523 [Suillus clintonianus]KAG2155610.1 hypothetical protein DEU56DRAFT_315523 [Suillus clintonianus]
MSLEVAGNSQSSSSDNPYPGTHLPPLRKNTAIPLHSRSMSSLPLSQQTSTGEISASNRLHSLGISPLSGSHEFPRLHFFTPYRIHTGPSHLRPVSVSSITDLPSETVPVPLNSLARARTVLDPAADHHIHLTVPPGSDGQPGSDVLTLHDGPLIAEMVADGVRRYERRIPRHTDICRITIPPMTATFPVHE